MPRIVRKSTPSDGEFMVMSILWRRGPTSVAAVLEEYNTLNEREIGYTTVLAMLQVLRQKRWVRMVRVGRVFTWSAAVDRSHGIVDRKDWFLRFCFDGDRRRAVVEFTARLNGEVPVSRRPP